MGEIVRHHGLVPVPLDLDLSSMAPRAELLSAALSPASRVLVVAHIFGARLDMAPWVAAAAAAGLLLVEDCAEVFEGVEHYSGHAAADLTLFSFGSIKTCSALGGAVGWVRDGAMRERMRALQAAYPVRPRAAVAWRLLSYAGLCALQAPLCLGLAVRTLELAGLQFETFITGAVRGFAGSELIAGIRHRPPLGILRLLARKLGRFDRASQVGERQRLARLLCDELGPDVEVSEALSPLFCWPLWLTLLSRFPAGRARSTPSGCFQWWWATRVR